MSYFLPPWDHDQEPSPASVQQWLSNIYSKFQPLEQYRWNEANTDSLFYAGNQSFINRHFNFSPQFNSSQLFFPLIQQPVNMVTGFQRQHRKSINYTPSEGADPNTTDQYTRLIMHECNAEGINEAYSKACELACISGRVLMQPYLDFTEGDPAQGSLKMKVWEYNSYMADPYARCPRLSDAGFVWCQEYISRREASERFGSKAKTVRSMSGSPTGYGNFYFLPENFNMNRADLLIVSYVWYKWKKKKKKLYSASRHQFFDYGGGDEQLEEILYNIPDLEVVEIESPCWKLVVVLNDQLMFQGDNPLDPDGTDCPFVPVDWNYEPHISQPNLRNRSLVTPMRSAQFLLNRRILLNHDISESSINSGWMRKVGAVANEDQMKKTGQGYDVLINEGYEIGPDIQKIQPNAVPPSDMELANQMSEMIFSVSGINLENWSAQEDKQASSLTVLMKQAANLMVLQKYFDQWDYSLKLLGNLLLKIVLNNWNAAKVGLLLGEEPSPHFYSRIFAKYQVIVEEGLNTATQKNMQAQQLMDINQMFGREVFPPSMIVKDMNLSGKGEAMEFLQNQEKQAAAVQQEAQTFAHAMEDAKLQELMSKAASNLATARERHGRSEADIGLFEERLSEITHNRAMATKAKMEALEKLIDVIAKYGEIEAALKLNEIQSFDYSQEQNEDREKADAKLTSFSNDFMMQMMAGMNGQGQQGGQGGQQGGQEMQPDQQQQQMGDM